MLQTPAYTHTHATEWLLLSILHMKFEMNTYLLYSVVAKCSDLHDFASITIVV